MTICFKSNGKQCFYWNLLFDSDNVYRKPGGANTHQTNCHSNDVYQAICLKLCMFVYFKLVANIWYFQRNRISTFDFIDKVHKLFAQPTYKPLHEKTNNLHMQKQLELSEDLTIAPLLSNLPGKNKIMTGKIPSKILLMLMHIKRLVRLDVNLFSRY